MGVADDEVVEDPDVEERERFLEAAGDELVGLAGLGNAGRVIMEEDHGGGVGLEHHARDLARVYGGAGDRATEEDLRADEAVTSVEEEEPEDLVWQRADLVAQVLARAVWACEDLGAGAEAPRHERRGAVEHFLSGGLAELVAVADEERVSHDRRLPVKLTTVLPHGA